MRFCSSEEEKNSVFDYKDLQLSEQPLVWESSPKKQTKKKTQSKTKNSTYQLLNLLFCHSKHGRPVTTLMS